MIHRLKDHLSTDTNPHRAKAMTCALRQEITTDHGIFHIGLRYVPDKLLLSPASLAPYLQKRLDHKDVAPESLAPEILEDIMDQLIPKWGEVSVLQITNAHGQKSLVTAEDRQPHWQDDHLLKRLSPLL